MELVRIPKELADKIENCGFEVDKFVVEVLTDFIAEAAAKGLEKQ